MFANLFFSCFVASLQLGMKKSKISFSIRLLETKVFPRRKSTKTNCSMFPTVVYDFMEGIFLHKVGWITSSNEFCLPREM